MYPYCSPHPRTQAFGDGAPPDTGVVACTKQGALCSASVSHTYQKAGTYVLRAYSTGCSPGAFQPDPATRSLSVVELKIQRLELYFPNRLPKINVKQYQRDLKAFVDIRYTGAGLLQGQWEIDGRLFTKVNKQLYQGVQKVTLQTPLAPPLPTYAVGTHRVSFVITQPGLQIEFPQAIYFVEAETGPSPLTIQLVEPFDNQTTATILNNGVLTNAVWSAYGIMLNDGLITNAPAAAAKFVVTAILAKLTRSQARPRARGRTA